MIVNLMRVLANSVLVAGALAGAGLLVFDALAPQAHPAAAANAAQDKKEPVDDKTISALIAQMGDDLFDKREAAEKRLAEIGEPALMLLRKAAQDSSDPEIRLRAEQLARAIGAKLFYEVRRFQGHTGKQPFATRVLVTPDGKQLVSVGVDALRSWDLGTGKALLVFEERKGAACFGFAMSPDGRRVIAGCGGKQGHVFEVKTGKRVKALVGHTAPVWGVALLADNKRALTGGWDQSIRVWDLDSGMEIRAFEGVTDNIRCLTVSPDGKLVAAGHFAKADGPSTVRLWDLEAGKEIRAMEGHMLEVSSVAFSPDGKTLLSTSFDKTLRLWDVASGKELKRLVGHTGRIEQAAFTPDSKRIVSCGDGSNPSLRLWDAATGMQLLESQEVNQGFTGLAVLPDGNHCVTTGRDGIFRVWHWTRKAAG